MHSVVALYLILWIGLIPKTWESLYDETVPFPESGKLVVENQNGDIDIKVWDQDLVRIKAVIKVRERSPKKARELLEKPWINVERDRESIVISTLRRPGKVKWGWFTLRRSYSPSVDYEIQVPKMVNLSIENVNGSISVAGTEGDLRASVVNGKIFVESLLGNIDADLVNGSIRCDLEKVTKGSKMVFSCVNGFINVSLPDSIPVDISTSTVVGRVTSEFPTAPTQTPSEETVTIRADTVTGGIRIARYSYTPE